LVDVSLIEFCAISRPSLSMRSMIWLNGSIGPGVAGRTWERGGQGLFAMLIALDQGDVRRAVLANLKTRQP
jgi:hypothetical protein